MVPELVIYETSQDNRLLKCIICREIVARFYCFCGVRCETLHLICIGCIGGMLSTTEGPIIPIIECPLCKNFYRVPNEMRVFLLEHYHKEISRSLEEMDQIKMNLTIANYMISRLGEGDFVYPEEDPMAVGEEIEIHEPERSPQGENEDGERRFVERIQNWGRRPHDPEFNADAALFDF